MPKERFSFFDSYLNFVVGSFGRDHESRWLVIHRVHDASERDRSEKRDEEDRCVFPVKRHARISLTTRP